MNQKGYKKQDITEIGPKPMKKWKKDNDDDKVKSLNPQVKIDTVAGLYEERPKYEDELHQKLFKARVLDKSKPFGEESDEDQPHKPKTKQEVRKEQRQEKAEQKKELRQDKKNSRLMEECRLCLQNEQIGENYILANGHHTILLFPEKQEFFDQYWHFQIIPIEHVSCIQELEEDPWQEIRNFMKCLTSMLDSQNCEAVFYENAYKFDLLPHCVLNCVGIPYPKLKDAKLEMYFRQGMDDLDGFWSTHKKIIKLSKEQGGIRKQIPKGFPYFYVDFATQFGYAHVIEEEKYFKPTFAPEILATILGVDKNKVLSPQPFKNEDAARLRIKFDNIWEKYDWTKMIK